MSTLQSSNPALNEATLRGADWWSDTTARETATISGIVNKTGLFAMVLAISGAGGYALIQAKPWMLMPLLMISLVATLGSFFLIRGSARAARNLGFVYSIAQGLLLGGMAMKWRWRDQRRAQNKSTEKPNLVMGANVQVCWHKFCRYWDIEPREVPCEGDRFTLNAEETLKYVDENTIGVVAIMGSTFDGRYEPVEEISDALDGYQKETGLDIPIHVDGASGGFVAPFLQPEIKWDFRLPRVKSINASGHKYGLVYPGVGWVIFRDKEALPEDLIFHVTYLGGDMMDLSINFSRPGNRVVAQYYNFLRLGREGYTRVHQASQRVALGLSAGIGALEPFDLITDGSDIPVFCWKMNDDYAKTASFTLYDIAEKLRERGWLVPAYPMPQNRHDLVVQRVVVKEDFSMDVAEMLLKDIKRAIEFFESRPQNPPKTEGSHFSH